MLFPRPYTVMYHEGQVLSVRLDPHGPACSPALGSGLDKVRFGLVGLYLRLTQQLAAAGKGHRRRVDAPAGAGDRVYERMWQPLLVGKFGERYA